MTDRAPPIHLRVTHPSIDPYEIAAELGLPPVSCETAGGVVWTARLAGNEGGHGDVTTALRDIAARFAHYRFFVEEVRSGGGRVDLVVAERQPIAEDVQAAFRELNIGLAFP